MKDSFDPGFIDLDKMSDLDKNDKGKNKITIGNSLIAITEKFVIFAILLMMLEMIFHIWAVGKIDSKFFLMLVMTFPTAAALSLLNSFFSKKTNKIITWVVTGIFIFIFVVNILYHAIFKVYFSVNFIDKTNVKVVQYYRETFQGIVDNWFILLLIIVIPVGLTLLLNKLNVYKYRKASPAHFFVNITFFAVSIVLEALITLAYGKDAFSPYDLMVNECISENANESLGVIATAEVEIKFNLFPNKDAGDDDELSDVWVYTPTSEASAETEVPDEPEIEVPDVSSDDEIAAYEAWLEEHRVDTSPNMLDIDFVALSESEPDEYVAGIHKYMSTLVPTNKNEYTGMFKGYNLIFLTCEGFSNIAVDEELTPTLYKLTHEGFVFTNFYNPRTGGSTSDGEFVNSTSLFPMKGGASNFKRVGRQSMPFSLGNMFNRTYGITSRAYHDNDFEYYGRDITYPGMGYYYTGVGNGLEIEKHWPESDLQMIEATLPEFIDDDLFNVYYMTVSGHLNYNFVGNWCSKKHMEEVQDLPYSEPCRAYIACQMELDLALKYLIEQLEEKGIADKTVICFTGDHWPYGLTNEEFSEILGHDVDETFELYKSNLVLWSASIEEPIVIDKVCCSMDIQPTLMNLFGFDYDSRLFMGYDILSTNEGFVAMWDKSILTDTFSYNSQTKEVIFFTEDGQPPEGYSEEYLDELKTKLSLKRKYSERIIDYNYYKYIADYLGIEVVPVEQNYFVDYSKFTP